MPKEPSSLNASLQDDDFKNLLQKLEAIEAALDAYGYLIAAARVAEAIQALHEYRDTRSG